MGANAASVVLKDFTSRELQRSAVQKQQSGVRNHLAVKVINKRLPNLWIHRLIYCVLKNKLAWGNFIILNTLSFFNSVAVLCPQLPEPINGHINCSSEEPTFGTFCIFSCHEGHQLEDPSNEIVMCNYNGSWSGEVAVCQGKQRIMTVGCR